jgi:signal transduction histidine kinase
MNNDTPVKILLVEDDEDDLLILKDYLGDSFLKFDICWAKNNAEFIDCLEKNSFDIVITDYMLGSTSGIEVLKRVKDYSPSTPVILLTGKGNDAIDMEAMKLGADDYFVKGNFDSTSLERSIRYSLERANSARILKENEDYQNRLNKIVSAGRIARMLAHEVRSPLTNILLSADQLRHAMSPESDAAFYIDIICKSSDKINQLVTDLIDSTRFGDIRMEKQNLVDVVRDTVKMAEDRTKLKGAKIREQYSHEHIEMELDSEKMKIALLNIIINALEAIDENEGEIDIDVSKSQQQVIIQIRDNGSGMSEETLENLFEPFYTSKPKGSGIGLTSTQNIVLSHKGKIDVKSELGKGSKFIIYFPLPG